MTRYDVWEELEALGWEAIPRHSRQERTYRSPEGRLVEVGAWGVATGTGPTYPLNRWAECIGVEAEEVTATRRVRDAALQTWRVRDALQRVIVQHTGHGEELDGVVAVRRGIYQIDLDYPGGATYRVSVVSVTEGEEA